MQGPKVPTAKAANSAEPLAGKRVVLGISGGIAAYKAAELTRLLRKAGATVQVVMTHAAQAFIPPLTLQTLSGHPVATELFDLTQESEIGHITLADSADLLVIAPATADLLARLSLGLASDLLTTVALACQAPLLLCPAMNVNMWSKPQVQQHVAQLVAWGAHIVGPASGELACGWVGAGRLVEPMEIVAAAESVLASRQHQDLRGRWVVITAGPTYEAIDPVRFIGNRSSGKMGFALAADAAQRGAEVTLVAGPVALETPPGVHRINVESAREMSQAVLPLRGKILNTEGLTTAKALTNQEIADLVTAIGTGAGEKFNIDGLRYGKIILLMDADADGCHIATLMLDFLFRHMLELVKQGHVYIAQPPLYRVNVGKDTYWARDDKHKEEIIAGLRANAKTEVTRFKGLGEMDAKDLASTTLDRKTRTLLRVQVESLQEADNAFVELLGKEAEYRYKFIMERAEQAATDELDV